MIFRRSLFGLGLAALAAPAIVRASSIMSVRVLPPPDFIEPRGGWFRNSYETADGLHVFLPKDAPIEIMDRAMSLTAVRPVSFHAYPTTDEYGRKILRPTETEAAFAKYRLLYPFA